MTREAVIVAADNEVRAVQDDRVPQGDFSLRRDLDELISAPVENVFSLKVNYWIGL